LEYIMQNDIKADAERIAACVKLIEKNQTGKKINLTGGFIARIEYGKLIVESPVEAALEETEIIFDFPANYDGGGVKIKYTSGEIAVRSRKDGDRFSPEGMSGTKKLSDYFIDNKIGRGRRDLVPVLTIDGVIAAVGGRRDAAFVPDEDKNDGYFIWKTEKL